MTKVNQKRRRIHTTDRHETSWTSTMIL
jgi:hypothetical protein